MGIICRFCFPLIVGTACGVYLAQNYKLPNMKKLVETGMSMAKKTEEKYRMQPEKHDGVDNKST
ncbi:hypothetical protein QN277_009274 [Acacia crassicarpa]|uniref:Uncharacterized protein n=1 Tax=Acacia crassicarpa TaxID=499986 RepID=A0AAE1M7I5_9FABA|nr:hypothetical protein QN277_009274 [Acacia crassicarpa]